MAKMNVLYSALTFCMTLLLADNGDALKCYSCYSNMEGCGKELNIRVNRQRDCPGTGKHGGENFCVKVIQKVGSEELLTRECLETLREHTFHRSKLPTVQRHGYCEPARNDDPKNPFSATTQYCFCNDYNGCNTGSSTQLSIAAALTFACFATVIQLFCLL